MAKKSFFLGANWKMNPIPAGALEKDSPYFSTGDPQVVVFPALLNMQSCIRLGNLIVGAQCGRAEDTGAFTGDVSMKHLQEFGVTYVLCGHSERRRYHGETDEMVGTQVASAIAHGLTPILCIGETAEEHGAGKTKEILKRQIEVVLKTQTSNLKTLLIAYEPVWAISGGDPTKPAATAADAQEVHAYIRSLLPKELQSVRILYGGSMKGSNAAELLKEPDIDGGLIGGASLKPQEFAAIITATRTL